MSSKTTMLLLPHKDQTETYPSEDEMLMMTNMTDAVNIVLNALRETGPAHVDLDLYLAFMEMHGFTTEALIVAYTYLLENKALAQAL